MYGILKVRGVIREMVSSLEMYIICCITLVVMIVFCLLLNVARLPMFEVLVRIWIGHRKVPRAPDASLPVKGAMHSVPRMRSNASLTARIKFEMMNKLLMQNLRDIIKLRTGCGWLHFLGGKENGLC
jgi:hypothetical protein